MNEKNRQVFLRVREENDLIWGWAGSHLKSRGTSQHYEIEMRRLMHLH
jgi:hypothetical protein